jgi:D-sedoheptulose 7-phosphate isomerase
MSFPSHPITTAGDYYAAYVEQLGKAARSVRPEAVAAAAAAILAVTARDGQIFACGNGGSAAIANHLVCDCVKSVQTDTAIRPRIHSLSANVPFITAVANDFAYEEVFAYQLKSYARPGDLLITISSSGDSENIVRAVQAAAGMGVETIAFTGFSGGRSRPLAGISLHVDGDNYGVIEDVHQSLMHTLAQFIRQSHMPPDLVATRRF